MEIVCKIIEQQPLQERETIKDGVKEIFASVRLKFMHGSDTFYGELLQESARKAPQYQMNGEYVIDFSLKGREYETQDHRKMYDNRIVVNRIAEY